jgi:hypothetical protein
LRSIINFKSKMIHPNRSIQSPYQNLLVNQSLYFFEIYLLFFGIEGKPSFLDEPEFSDQVIFSSSEKIAKKNLKNIKFGLLVDFHMKIRLNGSDRLFLT